MELLDEEELLRELLENVELEELLEDELLSLDIVGLITPLFDKLELLEEVEVSLLLELFEDDELDEGRGESIPPPPPLPQALSTHNTIPNAGNRQPRRSKDIRIPRLKF